MWFSARRRMCRMACGSRRTRRACLDRSAGSCKVDCTESLQPTSGRDHDEIIPTFTMPLFDFYIMVDWSGAARRRGMRTDSIWITFGNVKDETPETVSPF